jgi:2-phosphosulfolactate phosphatase
LLTARATADLLRASVTAQRVTFVITGNDGRAEEDLAAAEYIAALLADEAVPADRYVARAAGSDTAAALRDALRVGYQGVDAGDLALCFDADRFDFAMQAVDDGATLTLRPVTRRR